MVRREKDAVAEEVEVGQWRWNEGWPQPGEVENGNGGDDVLNGGHDDDDDLSEHG